MFEIVLAALAALALALVARGLRPAGAGRTASAVTLQLVGLPFGVRLWQFGYWWAAVPALAVVRLATSCCCSPSRPGRP